MGEFVDVLLGKGIWNGLDYGCVFLIPNACSLTNFIGCILPFFGTIRSWRGQGSMMECATGLQGFQDPGTALLAGDDELDLQASGGS